MTVRSRFGSKAERPTPKPQKLGRPSCDGLGMREIFGACCGLSGMMNIMRAQ